MLIRITLRQIYSPDRDGVNQLMVSTVVKLAYSPVWGTDCSILLEALLALTQAYNLVLVPTAKSSFSR